MGCWPPPAKVPFPAPPCHYVIPGSNCLDPPYSARLQGPPQFVGQFPFPRQPWPFESETRAPGTGLISGNAQCPPPQRGRFSPPWFRMNCC